MHGAIPTPIFSCSIASLIVIFLILGPLWPQTSMKQIHLWERFFCRWNVNSHPVSPPDCCGYEPATWQDDW